MFKAVLNESEENLEMIFQECSFLYTLYTTAKMNQITGISLSTQRIC